MHRRAAQIGGKELIPCTAKQSEFDELQKQMGHSSDIFLISSQSVHVGNKKTCIKSMALSSLRVEWSQSYLYKLGFQEGGGESKQGQGYGKNKCGHMEGNAN